jgi:hypothetical protein
MWYRKNPLGMKTGGPTSRPYKKWVCYLVFHEYNFLFEEVFLFALSLFIKYIVQLEELGQPTTLPRAPGIKIEGYVDRTTDMYIYIYTYSAFHTSFRDFGGL